LYEIRWRGCATDDVDTTARSLLLLDRTALLFVRGIDSHFVTAVDDMKLAQRGRIRAAMNSKILDRFIVVYALLVSGSGSKCLRFLHHGCMLGLSKFEGRRRRFSRV
jgi:hypothetical protein